MQYVVKFERVGRNHHVPDLEVQADDADELAYLIYKHVNPMLLSDDVNVGLDLVTLKGNIVVGFNNGGSFTVEEIVPAERSV